MKMEHCEHFWSITIAKLYNRFQEFFSGLKDYLFILQITFFPLNFILVILTSTVYVPKKSEIKVDLYRNSYHGLVVVEISCCKIIHKMSAMNKSD